MKRYTLILFFFILVLSSNAQTIIVRDPEIKKMVDAAGHESIVVFPGQAKKQNAANN